MAVLRVICSGIAAIAFAAMFFGICATGAAASPVVMNPGFQNLSRVNLGGSPDTKPKGSVAYDSIQWSPPGTQHTVSSAAYSEGYECCQLNAFGDAVTILHPGARLKDVGVVFSVWACQSGNGYDGSCSTAKGATFTLPITMTVYAACAPSNPSCSPVPYAPPGGGILSQQTITKTFRYRPSASPHCNIPSQTLGGFIDPVTKYCTWGLAQIETFNMSLPTVLLPQTIVISIAFNTSSYGANPYGYNTTCFVNGDSCPYDSLNVQLLEPYPTPPSWKPTITGSVWDSNGLFLNEAGSYPACSDPNFPLDQLALDDNSASSPSQPCWPLVYHPQIEVTTF